jgi:hypothetical protein
MSKNTRANFYEALMLGKKQGCDIYKAGSDDIRVRPGWYHFSDGMANYIATLSTETLLDESEMGTNAEWNYIMGDKNGNISLVAGTGAVTVRPSDNFYGWAEYGSAGFNHLRQGYYNLAGTLRILGAIWRVDADNFYIINQGNGSDEIGENSRGSWERIGNKQECRHYVTNASWSGSTNRIQYTWTFPVVFINTTYSAIAMPRFASGDAAIVASVFQIEGLTHSESAVKFEHYSTTAGLTNPTTTSAEFKATGYWHA